MTCAASRRPSRFSALGDMLALITLVLAVHELTGSGFAVSALFATTLVPVVAMAPLAGLLVGPGRERPRARGRLRWPRRVAAAGLAFADGDLAALLVLSALLSAAVGDQPARRGCADRRRSRARERLAEANGADRDRALRGLRGGPAGGGRR